MKYRPMPTTPEGWAVLARELEAKVPEISRAVEALERAKRITQKDLAYQVTI